MLKGQEFTQRQYYRFLYQLYFEGTTGRYSWQDYIRSGAHFQLIFFLKLKTATKQSYASIKKWYKGIDLLSKDFIVFPVCDNNHWNVIIVCYVYNVSKHNLQDILKKKHAPLILVLNSLGRENHEYTKPIRALLKYEWGLNNSSCPDFDRACLAELWPKVP